MVSTIVVLSFVVFAGCGKSDKQKQMEEAAKQMEEAGKQLSQGAQEGAQKMADAFKQMGEAANDGKTVEPINFRELKALLPESLPGLKRVDARGEKSSAFGINVSMAEGQYESEDGKSVEVKITDFGTMSGFVGMAAADWAFADVDRETETGYERSTTFNGFKAFEQYNTTDQNGELQVLIAKRFLVSAQGSNVSMDLLKTAMGKVDLAKLESLKNFGVTG
jgi:hypothetical protein